MEAITLKKQTPSTIYLCIYNLTLCLGWTILMIQFLSHLVYGESLSGLWDATSAALLLFQSLAILEVVHCVIGIVRSSAVLTFCQVFSRLFLTWAVLYSLPVSRSSIGFPMVLFAWSFTEIIRYLFYFLGLIGAVPHFLVYLRYTLFIGLYPLGVTGELLCHLTALPLVRRHRYLSMPMPNQINFAFDSYYAFILVLVMYIPVFPQLFFHMLAQRKKVLKDTKKSE